jgi:O-acetyl-ADP-ribose deacetylase (regulator of RNase III)
MLVQVRLVDVNPAMVEAWRSSFADLPEVQVIKGSMLEQMVSAWVSPTNARGVMDGGLDLVVKRHLGAAVEKRVQGEIAKKPRGTLAVGRAVVVPTGRQTPRYLISAPTMGRQDEDVSDTLNPAFACAAALQAAALLNAREPGAITSLALPGLGTATGGVEPDSCADMMRAAYELLQEEQFATFDELHAALTTRLADAATMLGLRMPGSDRGEGFRRGVRVASQRTRIEPDL